MVGDLVRDGAEEEPVGARHALVAHHDEIRPALLGDVEQRGRRVALAGVGRDLDPRRGDLLGRLPQRPLDLVAGADAPPLGAAAGHRLVRADQLDPRSDRGGQPGRLAHRFAGRLGPVRAHDDGRVHPSGIIWGRVIDLHCHVLPGIDDGPETMDGSLELARAASAQGTTVLVATPHVTYDHIHNTSERILAAVEEVNRALRKQRIDVMVLPGAEVALERAGELEDDELAALRLGGGPWLLVECPMFAGGMGVDGQLHALASRGNKIVLAHPERCPVFQNDLHLLERLVGAGMLGQVTASALTGQFGRTVERIARDMVDRDLIQIAASDAHNAEPPPAGHPRPPRGRGARRRGRLDGIRRAGGGAGGDLDPLPPEGGAPAGAARPLRPALAALGRSDQLRQRDDHPREDEHHDEDLTPHPERGHRSELSPPRAGPSACAARGTRDPRPWSAARRAPWPSRGPSCPRRTAARRPRAPRSSASPGPP